LTDDLITSFPSPLQEGLVSYESHSFSDLEGVTLTEGEFKDSDGQTHTMTRKESYESDFGYFMGQAEDNEESRFKEVNKRNDDALLSAIRSRKTISIAELKRLKNYTCVLNNAEEIAQKTDKDKLVDYLKKEVVDKLTKNNLDSYDLRLFTKIVCSDFLGDKLKVSYADLIENKIPEILKKNVHIPTCKFSQDVTIKDVVFEEDEADNEETTIILALSDFLAKNGHIEETEGKEVF